jgi:hypothetical protein
VFERKSTRRRLAGGKGTWTRARVRVRTMNRTASIALALSITACGARMVDTSTLILPPETPVSTPRTSSGCQNTVMDERPVRDPVEARVREAPPLEEEPVIERRPPPDVVQNGGEVQTSPSLVEQMNQNMREQEELRQHLQDSVIQVPWFVPPTRSRR